MTNNEIRCLWWLLQNVETVTDRIHKSFLSILNCAVLIISVILSRLFDCAFYLV